ncbi:hypothetical protein KQ51_00556 [Candidatus Izimaplasma bacterium HR1]|jgi:uncharacterized membrane protein/DUF4097 and DUF4098 domain-containing protein YvlB|uniref:DUF4097 family beta strand repeat-containing protein n=1 Tax=Candidatus Izimoplasma sp. HR1 TaxID=1541959 RepID=UPI0004F6D062|nr:hypothetical protein KQ51_00556 [Candidatus Izimaplasma bacterium HR1]
MNKLDFLRRLDRELNMLDKEERREIIHFYEERFYNGTIYENKTEEEVIAELERPEVIARNVLDEYGVSPTYVKKKEERYSNVSTGKAIFLIAFDVLIASSVIPALYGAAVAIIGSSFTWFTTIGLILGDSSAVDQYVFGFITAALILLFLFGLVVLEASLWFTRTLIKWHLNVFKVNNREKAIKKLSHLSLDSWFKKHRGAKRIKNLALVGALVGIVYSGYWILNHYDWVQTEYSQGESISVTITEDFETELLNGDQWIIETDLEDISVEIVQGSNDDVVIKHTHIKDDNFTYDFNYETNKLVLTNDIETTFEIFWDPSEMFSLLSGTHNLLRIELPTGLNLDDIIVETSNGNVYVRNIDFRDVTLDTSNARIDMINVNVSGDATLKTSNGKVSVSNSVFEGYLEIDSSNNMVEVSEITVAGNLDIYTTNGRVDVIDVTSTSNSNLIIDTSNNTIRVRTTGFDVYTLDTTNGKVTLGDLNTTESPASSITVNSSNNAIDATNVYANNITMKTSNGDIDFVNEDANFHPDSLSLTTSSYQDVDTNVTE